MPDEKASEDAVLGGRLVLRQPLRGHRVGHDAILLAAATVTQAGEHAIDLGAGVGGAGLALARRIEQAIVASVTIDLQNAVEPREQVRRALALAIFGEHRGCRAAVLPLIPD